MPLDLNQYDLEKLTNEIARLRPGQALASNDGLVVRRRHNSSGYDCGVGKGGRSPHKMNSAAEAAESLLTMSARFEHPQALGGVTSFGDLDSAIESVRKGESTPTGPSPAVKAIRAMGRGASLSSYRARAQQARKLLASGKVYEAVRQIEAVLQHATSHDSLDDAEKAEAALEAIREHHEYEPGVPTLTHTKLEIKTRGNEHFVFQDGRQVYPMGMTRSEAEARKLFLARRAARDEDVNNIDREIAGKPIVIERAEEAA